MISIMAPIMAKQAEQKIPCTAIMTMQRTYFLYAVPPRLFCALITAYQNLSFDCNVSQRTGLGPLRVSFQMLPAKTLPAPGVSLCYVPHSTRLVNMFALCMICYFSVSIRILFQIR